MNVLFPLDGSDASYRALRRGLELLKGAAALNAVALHVHDAWSAPTPAADRARAAEPDAVLARAQEIAKDVGVALTMRGVTGQPMEVILEEAKGFDLVAVPARARPGFLDVLTGAGADKVVRHAPTSVLVIKE